MSGFACSGQPPFVCGVCGAPTLCAPSDGSPAVCPDHCPDHDYVNEPGLGWACLHCSAEPPADHFDNLEDL